MSKESIELKYRPTTFDEIVGNEKEVQGFVTSLDREDGKRAFVITGGAGCGKTTLARIAAKHVGGDELSISELNTADNRGIETVRAIIEQSKHTAFSKAQVFIIDEAHGMTTDAKRAFLKITEEPPKGVYFFFLTTDAVKLFKGDEGKALKRRLQPVKVAPLKSEIIYRHLRRVNKKERLEVSIDVLQYIADNSNGSCGTALMLLGTVKDLQGEDLQMEKLQSIGDSKDPEVFEFCQVLFRENPSWKTLANYLLAFKEKKDSEEVRRIVMGYAQSILLKSSKGSARAGYILECFCDAEVFNGFPAITLATYQAVQG